MAGPRYIADCVEAVRRVELDGLTVLYHAPSGMTHIVAAPAPEILDALRAGPANVGELMARLRASFEFEDEADDVVALRLAELEQAGLVRRA